jgi:magnesium-dependent phosphatase 1
VDEQSQQGIAYCMPIHVALFYMRA